MRIEELTAEQPITFLVTIGDKHLEFPSVVLDVLPRKHMIVAAPVMRDEKIISFHGADILVNMVVAFPDQKPHVFQNVTVHTAKNADDSLCYTVTTLAESKELNRRGAYRCYIGIDTSVRVGSHRGTISVTIKDISATGFAFSTSDEREFQENESVHAVLNDYVEETAKSYSFHLYGVIVRKFKLENGNMVYGCRFPARVIGLESYIMEKERIRLQRSRGTAKSSPNKN